MYQISNRIFILSITIHQLSYLLELSLIVSNFLFAFIQLRFHLPHNNLQVFLQSNYRNSQRYIQAATLCSVFSPTLCVSLT